VSELSRRGALKLLAAGLAGVGAGAAAHGYAWERHALRLVEADLAVGGLPPALDGLRVGLVTDLHLSDIVPAEDVERAIGMIRAAAPDVVVLGGDYHSYADRAYVQPVAEIAGRATAPHGVFAILGNHDDQREMPAALVRRGIEVLRNTHTTLAIRGERLAIAGVDFWVKEPAEAVARAVRGARAPVLLLAHDPRRLYEAADLNVGAVLSGHTHGGQVVLPFIGAPAAKKFPVAGGLTARGDTTLFVSRGVGTVVVPIRVNCPPEVAVLTLRGRPAPSARLG
jgi:predicted MPP superfamily phosphohydrolase